MNAKQPLFLLIKGGECPSCGKYIGSIEICNYCGAHIKKRLSLKLIKYTALSVAVLGVICLYLVAKVIEITTIEIKNITPSMNFATVGIKGIVSGEPHTGERYLSFPVSDETGELFVRAYGAVAEDIFPTPELGDSVYVAGSIQIKEDEPSLIISASDRVWVHSKIAITPIDEISWSKVGQIVRLSGRVKSYSKVKGGLIILVADQTGEIKVVNWGEKPTIWPGRGIECVGIVKIYREEIEVVARRIKFQ
ncbi:MAG: OB-fold nucleic acid binding domain-containing protein [bacterium]|nr:OB-fold nucleic acid binding domain-containing protein [bacterium]